MQFQSFKFRSKDGAWLDVATDSRIYIRADVKNFFTMHFDSQQIESSLENSRQGPLGSLARVSFFLRILLFKIRMSLTTDVSFFRDSGHIPMMVNIPVEAFQYLNPGSGIVYSWLLATSAHTVFRDMDMPRFDGALVRRGFVELSQLGLAYCRGEECRYRYTVDFDGRPLVMDLLIRRYLVERGFFPMFVEDTAVIRKQMGWDADSFGEAPRHGIYFEVSGLPKGGHPWDFWMGLGNAGIPSHDCPVPVRIEPIDAYLKAR
jgi:hypothetical protein